MNQIQNKVINAAKWSSLAEICAKFIQPITNMILARLLTPDAFGTVATINIVFSFAEIFMDAGFQKYIIQHNFRDSKEERETICVAFWSNLLFTFVLLILIILFRGDIASCLGDGTLEMPIVIACCSLPISALASIQFAVFKRNLLFRDLFLIRIVSSFVPLVITIPIAFFTNSFWALIIGTISGNVVNACFLTIKSKWKPYLFYDINLFKSMFSFSVWTLIESITIWLTGYGEVFLLGASLGVHYLGIYRVATSTVGQIVSLITAATTPVLFAALSRLQDNMVAFKEVFNMFQKIVGLLIIPLGVGMYMYRDLIRLIMLGENWSEATYMIGVWSLTSIPIILFSYYCSEVYRSLGKPKLSVLVQVLHLIVLLPVVYYVSSNFTFETFCTIRAILRLQLVVVNLVVMKIVIKFSVKGMVTNVFKACIATLIMFVIGELLLMYDNTIVFQLITIGICIIVYFLIILLMKSERGAIVEFIKNRH